MFVIERQRAAEERVEDHAARPDVDFGTGIEPAERRGGSGPTYAFSLSADDFRRRIVRRSAAGAQEVAVRHDVGQPYKCLFSQALFASLLFSTRI